MVRFITGLSQKGLLFHHPKLRNPNTRFPSGDQLTFREEESGGDRESGDWGGDGGDGNKGEVVQTISWGVGQGEGRE